MKNILVAYATKYGATREIAEKIGAVLRENGLPVEVLDVKQVNSVEPYQAVILGSAAYIFQWRPEAVRFVRKFQKQLSALPVWIFSSGPMEEGDPVQAVNGWLYPKKLKTMIEAIHPRDITVFHGALQREKLSKLHSWMMAKFPTEKDDYRDWEMITSWAEKIKDGVSTIQAA